MARTKSHRLRPNPSWHGSQVRAKAEEVAKLYVLYESAALVERAADSLRVETCKKEDRQQLEGNLAAMGGANTEIGA